MVIYVNSLFISKTSDFLARMAMRTNVDVQEWKLMLGGIASLKSIVQGFQEQLGSVQVSPTNNTSGAEYGALATNFKVKAWVWKPFPKISVQVTGALTQDVVIEGSAVRMTKSDREL